MFWWISTSKTQLGGPVQLCGDRAAGLGPARSVTWLWPPQTSWWRLVSWQRGSCPSWPRWTGPVTSRGQRPWATPSTCRPSNLKQCQVEAVQRHAVCMSVLSGSWSGGCTWHCFIITTNCSRDMTVSRFDHGSLDNATLLHQPRILLYKTVTSIHGYNSLNSNNQGMEVCFFVCEIEF